MVSPAVEFLASRPVRAVPKTAIILTTTTTTMMITITAKATLNECFAIGQAARHS
jgi:hypothetical protein